MTCLYCEYQSYIYHMSCDGCRIRHMHRESCKFIRKIYKAMHEQNGYQIDKIDGGKHCDCNKTCIRKSRIKKKPEDNYEQQTNRKGKKASSHR